MRLLLHLHCAGIGDASSHVLQDALQRLHSGMHQLLFQVLLVHGPQVQLQAVKAAVYTLLGVLGEEGLHLPREPALPQHAQLVLQCVCLLHAGDLHIQQQCVYLMDMAGRGFHPTLKTFLSSLRCRKSMSWRDSSPRSAEGA